MQTGGSSTGKALTAEVTASQPTFCNELPKIVSLELKTGGYSHLIYTLLGIWPSLQRLTCNSGCFEYPPLPGPRPDFALQHLGLDDLPSPEVLEWLIPQKTLRSFHVKVEFDYRETIQPFLERYGPGLRSLRLECVTEPFLRCCPNLEELDIRYMTLAVNDDLIETFPRTLRRVCIRYAAFGSSSLFAMIRSLPNLRVLTLPANLRYKKLLEEEDWVDFSDLARRYGVLVEYGMPSEDLHPRNV